MRVALALAALALAACTSDPPPPPPAPVPIGFAADPAASGAVVFLRSRSDASTVVLDVVARGAEDVHGVAFRVTWDPDALAFAGATSSPAWSKQSVAVAKEGSPGQLAVAWTEKGETGISATAETVLGTLTFTPKSRAGAALAFRADRSALADRRGVPLPVTWRGGTVAPR